MIRDLEKRRAAGRERNRRYRLRHGDEIRARQRKWTLDNRERVRAKQAEWRERNREKERKRSKLYRMANHEKCKAATMKWEAKNPGRVLAIVNARRARKLNATPSWADHAAIEAVYSAAARQGLTVDHIIPLKNPLVCGPHVPCNLQLLTRSENASKGNRFTDSSDDT